ncbi:hypothetical protein CAPTEDRAFT_196229 [Capitella teleta]|uniref:Uncharacterized protein n=1 Tax=Capitella teleta TaxID=283909 RepID=R7V385_CAPTE|nr:hypothetical protein CAPTEDRAFT_196229 [Capitella teleta]|eukprot:ELU10250.1 hypothetical protein CAPTEDRAFT_196229 [Capitella teleta]
MSKVERRRAFAKIRNCGILKKNSKRDDDYELIHKSQETASVVHCSVCKGSYSSKYFYRHKRSCTRVAIALKAALVATNEGEAFVKILNRFQDNEVGKMCREDEAIKLLGRHLLQKDRAKVDKTDEVAKSVMSDMRIIARLYGHLKLCLPDNCRTSDASDLLKRENWKYLVIAIDHMTFKNDSQTELKYGLKTAVYYLLIKLADVIIGEKLSAKGQEEEVVEVNLFLKLLKHHQNSFFGDAKYQINKARQEQLRLPARMPLDADMQKLRSYTVDKLSTLSDENLTQSEFVELRNLTCSRITLFNARRGGEVSRMKVGQWTKRNQWIDPTQIEKISEKEKSFFQKMELMYGTGKGNKLVSTLVPKDSIKAMDILTNCDVRIRAGVLIDNHFIFPTLNSHLHVQGWSVTHTVCQQAGLDATLINATTQRGRISTMYAAQDVAPNERALFYTHMGHTAEINEGTYQRPAAIQAVTRVGSYLQEVDKRHVDDNIEERRSEEGSSGLGSMQEESQGGARCSTEITDTPQPKAKAVVQKFMKENGWANMPYEKIRTKIMNEQRAQQAKMRKQLRFV